MKHLEQLASQWNRFERCFQLLTQWDSARGILFIADDGSGDGTVRMAVPSLEPHKVLELQDQSLAAWREETQWLTDKEHQGSLLEPTPKRICLVALRLDEFAESYHISLKGLFERSRQPFGCLASATDPERIPDYLRSHFFECGRATDPKKP